LNHGHRHFGGGYRGQKRVLRQPASRKKNKKSIISPKQQKEMAVSLSNCLFASSHAKKRKKNGEVGLFTGGGAVQLERREAG